MITRAVNHEFYDLIDLTVRCGDDAFVLGYPHFVDGGASFLPIWKRASIASDPRIAQGPGHPPRVLVDTATRQGMSGGPVFVRQSGYIVPGPSLSTRSALGRRDHRHRPGFSRGATPVDSARRINSTASLGSCGPDAQSRRRSREGRCSTQRSDLVAMDSSIGNCRTARAMCGQSPRMRNQAQAPDPVVMADDGEEAGGTAPNDAFSDPPAVALNAGQGGATRIPQHRPALADAAAVGRRPSSGGPSDSWHRTIEAVSATDPIVGKDLVVADDGSIPADQIARLGLRPGALLRVIESGPVASERSGLAGSLPDFPDLDWAAFERGSTLARSDLSAT